jgi:hypothetical protein
MNVMIPSAKKNWLPLVGGAALVALLVALWLVLGQAPTRPLSNEAVQAPPPVEIPEAVIEQVKWDVKAFPAGVTGKVTKEQKSAIKRNKERAGSAVIATIDALIFEPKAIPSLTGRSLTPGTAKALARSKLIPAGIKDIKVIRRAARIGIDVAGAKRAAARIAVGFRGALDSKRVRLSLTGVLWLERSSGSWKVVAFDGESRPYEAPKKKADGKKDGSGKKGKSS